MRSIIVLIVSLVCVSSFAAKIDATALTWEDSKGTFLGINSLTHKCEIKTDKNRFIVSRSKTKFSKSKVLFSWDINVIPNSKWNLSRENTLDQHTMTIAFSQATTNTYQIDVVVVNVPDKEKLNKKRTETAIVGFGYLVKQCKMLCDDYSYSIDSSVFKTFGKKADLMLSTRTFNIKYKNDKGKLVKAEYDLSELKSVYEILRAEAKKYNEGIEFKFIANGDCNP